MQKNISETIGLFLVKYIWLFCAVLIFLELLSTAYSTTLQMQRAASDVMDAASGELNSRVDSTLKLITGLTHLDYIADTSKSTYERAIFTRPFQEAYRLFMIAVTDEKGFVSSSDETEPPEAEDQFNLMYRDYMQRLYKTGAFQISDPILAGSDKKTMNYTIAVPILKNDKVVGSVFGSIYFDEIQNIIDRSMTDNSSNAYLFGGSQTLISKNKAAEKGTNIDHFWKNVIAFGLNQEQMKSNMSLHLSGSFWVIDTSGLQYILYRNIEPTEWTLVYSTNFFTILIPLLPVMLIKILIYISICFAISRLSRRRLKSQLASVTQLLDKMSAMHRQLFQSDSSDYTTMLEITRDGLLDKLTGLPTRTLFYSKLCQWDFTNRSGAVLFIDLDNLKGLNDTYGHDAGDDAIQFFAQVIKKFEETHETITVRYGGDEFVVVVNMIDDTAITGLCQQLCGSMCSSLPVGHTSVSIHASIGAALYPQHGTKPEDLIGKADLALYTAKRQGKSRWVLYSEDMISED